MSRSARSTAAPGPAAAPAAATRGRGRSALAAALLLATALPAALSVPSASASAAGPEPAPLLVGAESLTMSPPSSGWVFSGTAGRTQPTLQKGLGMWRDGTATALVDVPEALAGDGGAGLSVVVGADRCEGGADMTVSVDGVPVLQRVVDVDHGVLPVPGRLTAGEHTVTVTYAGDVVGDTCDRSLKVYDLRVDAGGSPAERLVFGPPTLRMSDPRAGMWRDLVGGSAETVLWTNASVSRRFTSGEVAAATLVLHARGSWCEGSTVAEVSLDGRPLATVDVHEQVGGLPVEHAVPVGPVAAGPHEVRVTFANDLFKPGECDRNLRLRSVALVGQPS